MKKKVFILLILSLLLIGCGKSSDSKEKTLLLSVSSYKIQSAATYDGIAIFSDGSIYTEYFSSTKSDYNNYIGSYSLYTKNGFETFVFEKWVEKDKTVSSKDLRTINNSIHKLKKEDTNCIEDSSVYSDLTIYKDDEAIRFSTSGDCDVSKTNKIVKELLEIVNDYKK